MSFSPIPENQEGVLAYVRAELQKISEVHLELHEKSSEQ